MVEEKTITHKHSEIQGERPVVTNTPRAGEPEGLRDRGTPPSGGSLGVKEDGARAILRNAAAPDPVSPKEPLGMTVPGYGDLAAVLSAAYDQAARGKGKERHANGKPFANQKILNLTRMSGIDAPVYQISKKALEAADMAKRGELDAAMRELLGSIVYAAAAVIYLGELRNEAAQDKQQN